MMSTSPYQSLFRNAFGRLVLIASDGAEHIGINPVRAHPISAPDEGMSLVGSDGHELDGSSACPTCRRPIKRCCKPNSPAATSSPRCCG